MGISLGDIASFATGVAKADVADTEERLKDRRVELQADRQFYIDMKTKKYESELVSFEKENKKYKAIEAVKSQFKGQEPSPSEFGAAYLQETNPTLLYQMQKDYIDNPELLQKQLAIHANPDFKTTTTRESLDIKLKEDVDAITADYKKQLEDARGDSRLVNAILGKRNKKIADTIQATEDSKAGVIKAKEIAVETTTDIEPEFKLGEEKPLGFRVSAKFMKDGNVVSLREKLNSNAAQLSYKDNAINTTVSVFKDNDFAKPSGFYQMNDKKEITGFTGAGSKLNEHISMLWGGAVNSYTDKTVYVATDGAASQASNVLRESNVNNTIKERITNYMHIEQPKKWFNDRENIVAIVPFSIVDVNNNIGTIEEESFNISGKGNQKLVAEVYAEVLKEYTSENNSRIIGEKDGQPVYGMVKPNRQFMNDIQTELLALNGKSSDLSRDIQNRIIEKLPIKDNKVDAPKNNDAPKDGAAVIKEEKTMKVQIGDKIETMIDNQEVRNMLAEDIKNGVNIKIINTIKQDEKIIDSVSNENVTQPIKKTPADFGQVNQPVFETLESILKVLDMPMTGEEIKNRFDISPGLKINSKTVFRPLS